MLNTSFILKLADYIESGVYQYDQTSWAYCIAGQACHMAGMGTYQSPRRASEFMGLTGEDTKLFIAQPFVDEPNTSRKHAVRVLRHLAATGKVNWDVKDELPATLTDTLKTKPAKRELADA